MERHSFSSTRIADLIHLSTISQNALFYRRHVSRNRKKDRLSPSRHGTETGFIRETTPPEHSLGRGRFAQAVTPP